MYNVPINSRFVKKQQQHVQATTRLMSTTNNVRKGGMSKLLLGTLFVSAAGLAYYQTSQKDQHFYQGDSDPYEKTKKNLSQLGNEIADDGSVKRKGQGALDELSSAGKHIKNSARLTGQAAQDALSHVEKEGSSAVNSFKDESYKLKENIRSDADKFLSEHHLKEGDRSPEYVVSHNHDQHSFTRTGATLKSDADQAAFNAANKLKETKDNVSHEVQKNVSKASNYFKDEKDNLRDNLNEKADRAKATAEQAKDEGKSFWSNIFGGESKKEETAVHNDRPAVPQKKYTTYDHPEARGEGNPMVLEKLNTDKTKPLWETSLEEHAEHVVHDTTALVDKDTEKVKKGVWDARQKGNVKSGTGSSWTGGLLDKASELETKAANELHERSEEAKSTWESLKNKVGVTTHDVKKDAENSWEDMKDKANSEAQRVKSNINSSAEDLSNKANSALHSAEDSASKASNRFKSESNRVASDINKTTQDVKDEGARLTRKASNNINDLHNEVSSNAEKWKKQSEQTAKSWYQKGTEQVKDGFENVKNAADKDLQWAEDKVQDTYNDAKDEVSRLFGLRNEKQEGLRGHVYRGERYAEEEAGHLRGTRDNVSLKPAAVVVEEAHGRDM